MGHGLIDEISAYIASHPSLQPFQTVSMAEVENAEKRLGFQLPELLRAFYTTIGNGYCGSSCDIIGLSGGSCSGFGNLVETYLVIKEGQESEGRLWKDGLLPFCDWGCNIISCVDCTDSRHCISIFEDFQLQPQNYSLEQFFEWWCAGIDILSQRQMDLEAVDIINPFTKEKGRVYRKAVPKNEP